MALSLVFASDLRAQTPEMTRAFQRGSSLYEAGMYEAATPYFERALTLSEQEFGPDSSRTGFVLKNLATVYSRLGRFADAAPLFQRALKIFEGTFGAKNELVAEIVNDLSIAYVEQGKYIQAEPLLERVMKNVEATYGNNDTRVAVAAYNYGYASEFLGDTKKARELYVRALQIWQSQGKPDEKQITVVRERLAGLNQSHEHRAPSLAPYLPRVLSGKAQPASSPKGPDTAAPTIIVDNSGTRTIPPDQPITPAPKPAATPAGDKKWHIQLAAFRNRDAADREARHLQEVHGALLGEAGRLTVVPVDLPKGTFYRIATGPLSGKEQATTLCNALKAHQQNCIVVLR